MVNFLRFNNDGKNNNDNTGVVGDCLLSGNMKVCRGAMYWCLQLILSKFTKYIISQPFD